MRIRRHLRRVEIGAVLTAIFSMVLVERPAFADAPQSPPPATITQEDLQKLIQHVNQQDEEIRELKTQIKSQSTTQAPPTTDVSKQLQHQEAEIQQVKSEVSIAAQQQSDQTFPLLQFHGFGDIDYHVSNQKGDQNAFGLGELDFFITSQLAQDLNILNEDVVAADTSNNDGIEIERLMLQWKPSEYFNIDVGRYHTQVGYYNTAYHHGVWFQTAVGRPFIDQFEDSGGIIPAHSVGFSIHGAVPGTSRLGLNYFVEVGNGREFHADDTGLNSVGNTFDDNSFKQVNLALTMRPEALPGWQFGAGILHDTLTSESFTETQQILLHAYAVYRNADWEFMSELYGIHDDARGERSHWTDAFFVQLARKFGQFTPYVRYTYLDADKNDPVFELIGEAGKHYGPAVGLRYDASTYLALKVQYEYLSNSTPSINRTTFLPGTGSYGQLTLQAAFTF